MKEVMIDIPDGMKPVWKNINGIQTLTLAPDNDSTLITGRIRTFDDALTELHKRTDNGDLDAKFLLDDWYNISLPKHTSDLNAFAKLRIITYALNEGWKATYSSFSSGADEPERYYP